MDDTGEVDAGDDGKEAEDDELKFRDGRLEGVIEPAAEVVVAGAGVGFPEEGGDAGGDFGVLEEREGRVVGGREGGRDGGLDGGERLDRRLNFANGVR